MTRVVRVVRVADIDPDDAWATLSSSERARLSALGTGVDRAAASTAARIASAALARSALAEVTGVAAHAISLAEGPSGKPSMINGPHHNVSRTDALVAVVVDTDTPVGIDIERVRESRRLGAVMQRRFSNEERQLVADHDGDAALRWFFQVWTRKEAAIKACGLGVGALTDLRTVDHGTGEWSASVDHRTSTGHHRYRVQGRDLDLTDFDDLGLHVGAVAEAR